MCIMTDSASLDGFRLDNKVLEFDNFILCFDTVYAEAEAGQQIAEAFSPQFAAARKPVVCQLFCAPFFFISGTAVHKAGKIGLMCCYRLIIIVIIIQKFL